ncbi:MAG: DAK2 domain-containing protein [Lawsonibacter sp.]
MRASCSTWPPPPLHEGSEASKQFVSKFGRAKSYGEQTIGTPDAGATSMAYFFKGLSKAN